MMASQELSQASQCERVIRIMIILEIRLIMKIAIIVTIEIIVTIALIMTFAILLVVLTIFCFLTALHRQSFFFFVGCGRLIIPGSYVRTSIL